jgi:tRNA (guanine-N7-)-methyltransferase
VYHHRSGQIEPGQRGGEPNMRPSAERETPPGAKPDTRPGDERLDSPEWETSEEAFRVNPYIRRQYDHPERLLPRPTRDALDALRAQMPADGLCLELGSGSGNFLLQLAQQYPRRHVLGFELRYKRLVKSAEKFERAGLRNAWVLREQGERFPEYVAPGSVDAIHVNFPDPWPRPSQWKKRMVNERLLRDAHAALRVGGRFHLRTDFSGYFLHVLGIWRAIPGFKIAFFTNDLERNRPPGPVLRSEFEQMFQSQQKPVFGLILEKTA